MDHLQSKSYTVVLAPVTAATTARTANLDTAGMDSVCLLVTLGAELNTNSTNVALQLSESDTTGATTFATFNADYNKTIDNTAAVVVPYHVDLKGRKRYIRVTVTPDTTTNGAVLSAVAAIADKEVRDALSATGTGTVVG